MSTISTDIEVRQLTSDTWKLLAPVTYSGPHGTVVVPVGFETDFASTPSFVWGLGMPKSGIYDPAAVVHDYLYTLGGHYQGTDYTKAEVDKIFEDALHLLGVGQPKRWMMYQAVKWFGRGAF